MPDVPKAILYSWPTSVWSTVPRLCLYEKGYSDDEYIIRPVDIAKGENFSPAYLKINMNGTIPTLVVPMLETTGPEVDSRYRSLRDTISICDFLDSARTSATINTTSDRPAPALAPATIEGKAASDLVLTLVHVPAVDPNFLNVAAQTHEQLKANAAGEQGRSLDERRQALRTYIEDAKKSAANAPASKSASADGLTYEQKLVQLLQEKLAANEQLWELYNGQAGPEREKAFYEASAKSWKESVPDVLTKITNGIKGPFVLGDQICLGDLHLISWLSRLVAISGGQYTPEGLDKLKQATGGYEIDDKLRTFWASWLKRDSFTKVYVDKYELSK